MRCIARIKIWNPEFVTWNESLQGNFPGKIYLITNCKTTTKIKSARCWREWRMCGYHAAINHHNCYSKGIVSRSGGSGRYGKDDTETLPMNQMVPIRIRKKDSKK